MTRILLSFLILVCFTTDASITEINELSPFKEAVYSLDENAMVFLDIDFTVVRPCDAVLLPCGRHLHRQYLHSLDLKRREFLYSIIALGCTEKLMDVTFLEIIKNLEEKNIPVIGLTALETGRSGKINNLADWRLTVLEKLGVKFSSLFSDKNLTTFDMLPQYNDNYPLFKNGVLLTNRQPKGAVFAAFMGLLNNKPKKIVFIDDSLQYLKSVEQAAKELNIEFIGFHYKAVENMESEFDEELGKFQFQYLIKNEHWLTDKQAREMVK